MLRRNKASEYRGLFTKMVGDLFFSLSKKSVTPSLSSYYYQLISEDKTGQCIEKG